MSIELSQREIGDMAELFVKEKDFMSGRFKRNIQCNMVPGTSLLPSALALYAKNYGYYPRLIISKIGKGGDSRVT